MSTQLERIRELEAETARLKRRVSRVPLRVADASGTAGSEVRNFRLEERKDKTATSVDAKLLDDALSPIGDVITVYDRHGKFSGPDQAKGVVEKIDGKWQISQLNTWANTIYGTAVGSVAVGAVGDGNVASFGGHEWHTADPGSSVKIRVPPSGSALADTDPYAAELWDETTNPPTYLVTGPTTSTPGTAAADSIKSVNVQVQTRKLTTDNSVSVLFLDDTNATVGLATTVHDPHNEFAGLQYALGRATRVKDGTSDVAGRWEFTHLEAPAEYICATLTTDVNGSGVATATVDEHWGSDFNRNNPGATVELESCGGLHDNLKSGQKVIARLHDVNATPLRYTIVEAFSGDALIAKLTGSVPKRVGTTLGELGSVELGHPVAGVWTSLLTGQSVWNPARVELWVPSGEEIYATVRMINGHWTLNPTELPQVTNWEPDTELHVVQCSSGLPVFGAKAPIVDLQSVENSEDEDCQDLQSKTHCTDWETWATICDGGDNDPCEKQSESITYVSDVACVDDEFVVTTATKTFVTCVPGP